MCVCIPPKNLLNPRRKDVVCVYVCVSIDPSIRTKNSVRLARNDAPSISKRETAPEKTPPCHQTDDARGLLMCEAASRYPYPYVVIPKYPDRRNIPKAKRKK